MPVNNFTTDELLRYVDRADPVVRELAERLEMYKNELEEIKNRLGDMLERMRGE